MPINLHNANIINKPERKAYFKSRFFPLIEAGHTVSCAKRNSYDPAFGNKCVCPDKIVMTPKSGRHDRNVSRHRMPYVV